MGDDVEADLRDQFRTAFEGADFPVTDPMDLVPALPDGPGTRFEAGDVSLSAMELASTVGDHQEFPYDTVDDLVDDLMAALDAEDVL
jgi:hypothetical protein